MNADDRVPAAPMPSGVEHRDWLVLVGDKSDVAAAPMPSGVEHHSYEDDDNAEDVVAAAPMPSGVEHSRPIEDVLRLTDGRRRSDAFGR